MRLMSVVSAAFILSSVTPVFAQEWTEFVSREDGFKVNVPSEPKVTETTYTSEYGADLPAACDQTEVACLQHAGGGRGLLAGNNVDRAAERIRTEN